MFSRIGFGIRVFSPTRLSLCSKRPKLFKRHCRKEISQEELLRLVGGNHELLEELLKDEPVPSDRTPINPDHVPIKPGFLQPLPPKGSRNAKLHRKTDVLGRGKNIERTKEQTQWKRWDDDVTTEEDFTPVPWNYEPSDLRPKEPFVYFPPKRELFCEKRSFHWTRENWVPEVGDIYPEREVQVEVTLTNDASVAEQWAQDRLTERLGIYGLETKWWMQEHFGLYISASIPKQWADLALLQLATENDILLLQLSSILKPLDMPIERLDRGIRQILKYKYIKKIGFDIQKKAAGLKKSEVQIHGCHDIHRLLSLQLGCKSNEELPCDVRNQDLASMAQSLLGLNVKSEDSSKARWELDLLDDSMIEIAAMEAWCCWALYGVVTRLDQNLVSVWNENLSDELRSDAIFERKSNCWTFIEESGVLLNHVAAAESKRRKIQTTPNREVAKASAIELAHDIAVDLENKVTQEAMNKPNAFKSTFD
eukprot:g4729.t1